jgi:hypothetical protein
MTDLRQRIEQRITDLRQRIEQRITDLQVERDIAAAADDGPWAFESDPDGHFIEAVGGFVIATSPTEITLTHENFRHIATQDPATTIARIDRELAGCAADLALLDPWPSIATAFRQRVLDSLGARYPSEESS